MKKILQLTITISVMLILFTACQATNVTNEKAVNSEQETTATTQNSKNKGTSNKKKYKSISANTKPIGISDIEFKDKDDMPYLECTVCKNGGDIEESIVAVTFELFDDEGKYYKDFTMKTSHSLVEGDSEKIDDVITYGTGGSLTDEILSKWKATVVDIKEIDAADEKKAEELKDIMYDIDWKITCEEYNSALTMLEMAKEEYPDSKELKLYEAEVKDKLIEKGVLTDGTSQAKDSTSAQD